jgi:hypothetical protein
LTRILTVLEFKEAALLLAVPTPAPELFDGTPALL